MREIYILFIINLRIVGLLTSLVEREKITLKKYDLIILTFFIKKKKYYRVCMLLGKRKKN
jgi:hypothetical protein